MDLDARFEALTQSMELLASLHKDNERRMERLIRGMEVLENKGNRLEGFVTEIAQGTARLLHVAEMHEQRLDRLEGHKSSH